MDKEGIYLPTSQALQPTCLHKGRKSVYLKELLIKGKFKCKTQRSFQPQAEEVFDFRISREMSSGGERVSQGD